MTQPPTVTVRAATVTVSTGAHRRVHGEAEARSRVRQPSSGFV